MQFILECTNKRIVSALSDYIVALFLQNYRINYIYIDYCLGVIIVFNCSLM